MHKRSYNTGQGPASAWLFGIALNVAREGWQRQHRDTRLARKLFGEPVRLTERDVAEFVELRRTAVSILEAIEGLPPELRSAVVDRVGEVPYAEASDRGGVSVAALKKRVSRGRQQVRRAVEKESGDDVL